MFHNIEYFGVFVIIVIYLLENSVPFEEQERDREKSPGWGVWAMRGTEFIIIIMEENESLLL
jgi:hypothetical protein